MSAPASPPRSRLSHRLAGNAFDLLIVVTVVAGAAFVLFVAYALLAAFVLHGPVTPSSLNASVTGAVGTASSAEEVLECSARGEQRWRCDIPDRAGSGGTVPYEVRTNSDSS